MTPAQRKANERARNTQAGLKRMELWAYPSAEPEIRKAAAKANARAKRAQELKGRTE